MARILFVLAVTYTVNAQVPKVEAWGEVTGTAWRNERTEVNYNFQHRSYPNRLDAYSTRIGPMAEHRLRDGVSLWGGVYFHHVQSGVGEKQRFTDYVRFFGGLNYRVYRKGILQIDGRTTTERWMGLNSAAGSTRLRQRVLVNFDQPIAPYFSGELFALPSGLLSNRTTVGLRTRFKPEWQLLTGVVWENRSFSHQPERYWLTMSIVYRRRART